MASLLFKQRNLLLRDGNQITAEKYSKKNLLKTTISRKCIFYLAGKEYKKILTFQIPINLKSQVKQISCIRRLLHRSFRLITRISQRAVHIGYQFYNILAQLTRDQINDRIFNLESILANLSIQTHMLDDSRHASDA